jgi:hypothetical protein
MHLSLPFVLSLTAGLCIAQDCPWDLETTPNPEGSLILYGIDGAAGDNIWAAGKRHIFQIGDSQTLNYMAHWDGGSWTEVSVPQPSQLRDFQTLSDVLAIDGQSALAVGTYNPSSGSSLAQSMLWDGSGWELLLSPAYSGGSGFYGLGKAGDQVWGVGYKYSELPPPAALSFPMAARLDGENWEVVFVPPLAETGGRSTNYLHDIEGASENDAWAVGSAQEVGTGGFGPAAMMVRWDGSDWSQYDLFPVLQSVFFSSLQSIDVLSSDDAWAAGYDYDIARQQTIPLILHWDGSSWSNIPVPEFDHTAELRSITARASDDVYAAGTQTDGDGYPHALILHWDGSVWSVIPEPELTDFGSWFRAMATVDNEVWVAGQSNGLSAGITQRLVDCNSCPADLNNDGVLDFFDVSIFVNTMPDFDGSGGFDFFDVSAFLNNYNAGCP